MEACTGLNPASTLPRPLAVITKHPSRLLTGHRQAFMHLALLAPATLNDAVGPGVMNLLRGYGLTPVGRNASLLSQGR